MVHGGDEQRNRKERDVEDSAIWENPDVHGMTSPSCGL